MQNLINIPEEITCIHPYVLTATATVASAIVVYLVKKIKEKDVERKEAVKSHMADLKEHAKNIQTISDKKTNLVLENLGNQITKLEVIVSKF